MAPLRSGPRTQRRTQMQVRIHLPPTPTRSQIYKDRNDRTENQLNTTKTNQNAPNRNDRSATPQRQKRCTNTRQNAGRVQNDDSQVCKTTISTRRNRPVAPVVKDQ